LNATGKPLLEHTYEAALRAQRPLGVCVACDHPELAEVVRGFGGEAVMTDPCLPSGTDRVAAIARTRPDLDILVNLQGDEPEMAGEAIDQLIGLLESRPAEMATLAAPIRSRVALDDPACVKVVFDDAGRALYFSRSAIPHARRWDDALLTANPPYFYQHLGLYAYRREFLLELAELPVARLESVEMLEQLRVLAAGRTILVGLVDHATRGIDTPADYEAFVRRSESC
jgi:3-deoxy-manno-octulosonate cytidylyltransferase (CMP-KDO synthetase)